MNTRIDKLMTEYDRVKAMMGEVGHVNFLLPVNREQVIDELIAIEMNYNSGPELYESALRTGIVGYNDQTDIELVDEYFTHDTSVSDGDFEGYGLLKMIEGAVDLKQKKLIEDILLPDESK
jgi:hypothetical protein